MIAAGIVFFPLLGAIIAGFFVRLIRVQAVPGEQTEDRATRQKNAQATAAELVTCIGMGLSAICAWIVLFSVVGTEGYKVDLLTWIQSGTFEVDWTIRVDPLSAVMMFVVSTVSTLIHIYSIGYMSHDPHRPRFMAYLSLFTFFMLALVTADNFLQLFFGWEGVGLVSYLLIGFWFTKPSACAAAIKAFLVNRVGDVGFALGIAGVYLVFDSVEFDVVFAQAADFAEYQAVLFGWEVHALTLVTFLLFIGAMGKSAQLGLHTWLPDAMEGPTPVSALIHAATMVTAGVFLVARCSPLFEHAEWTLGFVTFIGASTALFAATIGLVQNDIKRVIAYSTCSQLGYMFFAAGVGAYSVAIFHLYTHAFFKALLFLSAGSVIHAMSDEQDMRRMGGIWRKIPVTYAMMWIGSLALAGMPIFAGFYSKDLILEVAWASDGPFAGYAFWLGIIAAVLTAFYSWRLLFMTFHGAPRASEKVMSHVHESPLVMTVPLGLLAVGAIFAGLLGLPMVNEDMAFWGGSIAMPAGHNIIEEAHHVGAFIKILPILAGVIGIGLAYLFYIMNPDFPRQLAARLQGVYQFLLNKWFIDELYDYLFVKPAKRAGTALWRGGDIGIIDAFGPNGVAATALSVARRAAMLQTGYVYHYAFAMLIGVAALITWYLFQA